MTDKLAEEILNKMVDGFVPYFSESEVIEAMQAYHEAKLREAPERENQYVTDEDIHRAAYSACMKPSMPNGEPEPEHTYYDAFIEGAIAMRDGEIKHISRDNE